MIKPEVLLMYIDTVEKLDNKVYTNYELLSNRINTYFKVNTTADDIWNYYEPERLDVFIHNKALNMGY